LSSLLYQLSTNIQHQPFFSSNPSHHPHPNISNPHNPNPSHHPHTKAAASKQCSPHNIQSAVDVLFFVVDGSGDGVDDVVLGEEPNMVWWRVVV